MPLLDFINGGNSVIRITDHTTSDEENYININLDDTTYQASSEQYATGYWHHLWASYNGATLTLYIDGKQQTLTESGSLPASLSGSSLDLYINHSLGGYDYNIAKNTGYIDDIFLFNTSTTSWISCDERTSS